MIELCEYDFSDELASYSDACVYVISLIKQNQQRCIQEKVLQSSEDFEAQATEYVCKYKLVSLVIFFEKRVLHWDNFD